MQTVDEFAKELNLSEEQAKKIKDYLNEVTISLLTSLRDDTLGNFEDTIEALKSISG